MVRTFAMALVCASVFLLSGAAGAQEETVVLDACRYTSEAAAREAWTPAHPGTPAVTVATISGRPTLELPCNFRTNNEWRVAWDLHGRWDLSAAQEISVDVTSDTDDELGFTVYFHSGGGWYRGHFSAPTGTGTATLRRKYFEIEDRPGGWHAVDTIRVSISRREPRDRTVRLSGLRARIIPADVVLYANDAGIAQEGGIPVYVRGVADTLERLGVSYELLDDHAIAAGRLEGRKVAVLPLNPVLPPDAGAAIRKFVARDGKLIVCYCLPPPLDELLGIRLAGSIDGGPDDRLATILFHDRPSRSMIRAAQHSWTARTIVRAEGTRVVGLWADARKNVSAEPAITRNRNGYFIGHVLTGHGRAAKDQLIVEMLGELWPGVWTGLYQRRTLRLGHVAGLTGVEDLRRTVSANVARNPQAAEMVSHLLTQADEQLRRAGVAHARGDTIGAYELVAQADKTYTCAFAVSVPSAEGEFRAVWCHDPTGVRGRTWDEAMKTLLEGGFNTIIPNMSWGAGTAYPSKVLPTIDTVRDKGDQLALCLAAAKKYGIAVHVWRVNWALGWHMPKASTDKLQREGRLQQDPSGKTLRWLCPSQPVNHRLEIDAMLEVVRNYDVTGIHFDYIRYPGEEGCYCPRCRERFETDYKLKAANWPADVRTGPLKQQYLQFRRDNITAVVAAVAQEARKLKPGIRISAAVFRDWPSARDGVGQDWKLWVEKGYLDFVCPMQYTRSAASFEAQTRATLGWAGGRIPVYPGIGATLGISPDGTLEQLLITRKHKTGGFVLFNYDPALADEHLPLLRLGATSLR